MVVGLSLLVLELVFCLVIGAWAVAWLILALIVTYPILMTLVIALSTVWRLLDSNRLVLLAPDGGAVMDVIFKSRKRIALANHGRVFRSSSAPALRRAVANWIVDLEGYKLDIRAQNERVANLYLTQFPQLEKSGTDWMGHPKLGLRTDAAHV